MNRPALRYRAFLSYSHRDSRVAERLHRWLEGFRVPAALRRAGAAGAQSSLPARIHPVFRDRDELASSSALSQTLQAALDESEALVVVCSPASAASRWVNEEIRYFRERHPGRSVLAFVVAGDPGADPRVSANAALPLNLLLADIAYPEGALGEPLAADARDEGDGPAAARLKLAAGILAVRYDDLRQRDFRRRQQRWAVAGGASILLAVVFAVLAWQATVARDEARRARAAAELELQSERQTREFLISVFRLADAGEARGNAVTVREVLDKAVARIDATEFARPAIKSRFLASMGQAYSSLGLNKRSTELLRQSLAALPPDDATAESGAQRVDSEVELADVLYDMGDYEAAVAALDAVARLDLAGRPQTPAQRAHADNVRGDVLSRTDKAEAARAAYEAALETLGTAGLERAEHALIQARSLCGLAYLDYDSGDHESADRRFSEAIDLLRPIVGEAHPRTMSATVSRAANAYARGDYKTARQLWAKSLGVAAKVYDPDNPEIGTIKNNLGRLLLETGDLPEAEELLRGALKSDRLHRSEGFDDLAFSLHNLAYARWVQGDASEAQALLEEALPIAEASKHVMLGRILNGLADIRCSDGRAEEGVELAERALAANRERSGPEHWSNHQAALTLGYCRAMAGKDVDRAALARERSAIKAHWGPSSAFTRRADAQAKAISRAN